MANLDDMNKSLDDIIMKLEHILDLQAMAIENNVELQTRVAEQRDAPVHDAIELLHQVREFSGGAAVTLTSDFIAKIDAVLRTASGG